MKQNFTILLVVLMLGAILVNNYFKEEIPLYDSKIESLKSDINSSTDGSKFNLWMEASILENISKVSTREDTESYLIDTQNELKQSINSTLINFDKSHSNMLIMRISSNLARNDIVRLLNLFNLKLDNGHVKFNSMEVNGNIVRTDIDLIKFYREQ